MNLKRHFIACNASSAWSFDAFQRLVASTTASSHTLVIPRLVAKSQGDCPVVFVNSLISFALNRFAFVDMLAPLGVIAVFNPEISLAILFFAHSTPHFTRAVPYFPVLLAILPIAGAITFPISGQATAPVTPPTNPPVAISHIVACHPLSIIGCVAQNPAHTTPERSASDHTPLDQAK